MQQPRFEILPTKDHVVAYGSLSLRILSKEQYAEAKFPKGTPCAGRYLIYSGIYCIQTFKTERELVAWLGLRNLRLTDTIPMQEVYSMQKIMGGFVVLMHGTMNDYLEAREKAFAVMHADEHGNKTVTGSAFCLDGEVVVEHTLNPNWLSTRLKPCNEAARDSVKEFLEEKFMREDGISIVKPEPNPYKGDIPK